MHCLMEKGDDFAGMWSFREFGFRFSYYLDFYAEARRRFANELSEESIEWLLAFMVLAVVATCIKCS